MEKSTVTSGFLFEGDMAIQFAIKEMVAVGSEEYCLKCDCGYHKYISPTCACETCRILDHPLTKCPGCGRKIVEIDDRSDVCLDCGKQLKECEIRRGFYYQCDCRA